ncbi:MAG: glycosyltransferase, partial [Lysobacterales bacterium]
MTYLLVASPRDRTAEMETTINESDPTLRISVVIPTFQRAGALQACLLALSVGFPADAEVIVVSDGGDKASFPDLSRFEKHLNLVVIHAEHGGAGHARNQGLQRVQAPIVVFTDDDCLPQAGWLEAIAAQVSLDPPRAAGGKTISHPADNVYATAAQLVLDLMERDQRQKNYEPVFFPSNNIAFPTEALKQIGGFDAGFRTAEDREVCRRWLQAGCQLGKAPDSVLLHVTPLNFAGYWHKLFAYGEGAAQFRAASGAGWVIETRGYH